VSFDASISDATFKADINYAVGQWNALFQGSPFTTAITFDQKNIGAATLAGLTTYNTLDGSGRVKTSTIDLNTTASFFADSTPGNNSEFNMQSSYLRQNAPAAPYSSLSGSVGGATAAAALGKWDLVSVAEHEIGHALGIGYNAGDPAGYTLYANAVTAGSGGGFTGFNISGSLANLYPTDILPVLRIPINGSHFDGSVQSGVFNNTLMADPGFAQGQRSLITDLDLLGIATMDGLTGDQVFLPTAVPEPGTIGLMIAGACLVWVAERGRRGRSMRMS
jgi:hypothetical protein